MHRIRSYIFYSPARKFISILSPSPPFEILAEASTAEIRCISVNFMWKVRPSFGRVGSATYSHACAAKVCCSHYLGSHHHFLIMWRRRIQLYWQHQIIIVQCIQRHTPRLSQQVASSFLFPLAQPALIPPA